jgi:hypothetical protein
MTTVATRRAAALAEPGGAATRYEQTKRVKYQPLADEMDAVPMLKKQGRLRRRHESGLQ